MFNEIFLDDEIYSSFDTISTTVLYSFNIFNLIIFLSLNFEELTIFEFSNILANSLALKIYLFKPTFF